MSVFAPSNHKFVDPVRYFKENDPYYWEVDNIPLKQLQENCLWLKDQIEYNAFADGIERKDFNELRPYVTGSDSVARVKPGRFTARINDAYKKPALQKLELLSNTGIRNIAQSTIGSQVNYSKYQSISSEEYAQNLYAELQGYAASSFNLNGLAERVLSWPYTDSQLVTSGEILIENSVPVLANNKLPPILAGFPFRNTVSPTDDLQQLSIEFIRQFRGVARTAIVDVPEELTLTIPEFNAQDFYVLDSGGNPIYFPENQLEYRIDLLFIYSKPIDVSSSYIQQYTGQQPKEITKPILGLVKGAGVGIRNPTTTTTGGYNVSKVLSDEKHTSILAQGSDKVTITNGFQSVSLDIHGSFPSPDDLMSLSPVISERLAESDPRLIGQTILPVAYIVVRKSPAFSGGVAVIPTTDLLDIRPFFRTTELTYSERAGIAAALPSPSLANPVVTRYNIEDAVRNIKSYVDSSFEPKVVNQEKKPIVVAAGVVQGGSRFGAEGILTNLDPDFDPGYEISTYPTWDLARWWSAPGQTGSDKGTKRGDCLDVIWPEAWNTSYFGESYTGQTANRASDGDFYGWISEPPSPIGICKKTIVLNRSNFPVDYQKFSIQVAYRYVCSRTQVARDDDNHSTHSFNGLYVEQQNTPTTVTFIIYSAAAGLYDTPTTHPSQNDRDCTALRANYVVNSHLMPLRNSNRLQAGGVTYPTVEFTITAYPTVNYFSESRNQAVSDTPPMNITLQTV